MNKTFEESYLLEGAFFKKSLQDSSFTFGNTNAEASLGFSPRDVNQIFDQWTD